MRSILDRKQSRFKSKVFRFYEIRLCFERADGVGDDGLRPAI